MLTILRDGANIKIISSISTLAVNNPSNYSSIVVTGKINCCGTETKVTRVIPFIVPAPDDKVEITSSAVTIRPSFFELLIFPDGVYSFELKVTKVNNAGFLQEANCAFIDMTLKCKVAATLERLVQESDDDGILEPEASMVHLLHYALVNGSNCRCNCDDLCKAFKELLRLLSNINPQISTDCGC